MLEMTSFFLKAFFLKFDDPGKRKMAGKSVLKLVNFLVDFFDGGSTSGSGSSCTRHTPGSTSTWHTSRHTPRGASSGLVQLSDDGVADTFNLLLFIFVFILLSSLIGIKPSNNFITFVHDGFLIIFSNFILEFFILNGRFHVETIRFEAIFSGDTLFLFVILSLEFLSISHHFFNVFLGQSSFVICDGDFFLLTRRFVDGGYVENTVGIDVEGAH